MRGMRPIATNGLRVGRTGELQRNGWTNRDPMWRTESCGSYEQCNLDGINIARIHSPLTLQCAYDLGKGC